MIDIQTETLRNFSEAAATLPDRPHVSTLHRWRQRGIGGVRLETVRLGGRRYTSDEALARFFEAVTAAADQEQTLTVVTPQRRRQLDEVDAELARAGIRTDRTGDEDAEDQRAGS